MNEEEASCPTLSIVTICKNHEGGLRRTLDSIIGQTDVRSGYEVIVVDGASADGSVGVAQTYMERLPIVLVSEPDNGVYDAMNKGWRKARGEWVQFLNAGDSYQDSACLTELLGQLRRCQESEWLVARTCFLDASGAPAAISDTVPHHFWLHASGRRMHAHPSTLMRRSLILDLGGFTLDFGSAGDFDLVLRAGLRSEPASWDRVLARFEQGGISVREILEVPNRLQEIRRARLRLNWCTRVIESVYSAFFSVRWRQRVRGQDWGAE